MFNNLIKGKAKSIGTSVAIVHNNSQYYLNCLPDYSDNPITIILDANDNKEEAIHQLIEMKNWLTLGDDGDIITFTDKDNSEYMMMIRETLLTKSIGICCQQNRQDVYWPITRQMLNKAIRILKSW